MAKETNSVNNSGRQRSGRAYWDMQRRCAIVAGSVNVLMLIIFSYIGLQSLADFSIASIGAYALAYLCLQKRRNMLAMLLICSEVIVHAGFGFLVAGPDGAAMARMKATARRRSA